MFDTSRTGVRRGTVAGDDSGVVHLRGTQVAVIAIIVIALTALGLEARVGLQNTVRQRSAATAAGWNATYAQEECIYRAIRAALPKGAHVFVRRTLSYYYWQILIELATPWIVPQPTVATARWRIALIRGGSTCPGLSLTVEQVN